jgi:hypothetical protein
MTFTEDVANAAERPWVHVAAVLAHSCIELALTLFGGDMASNHLEFNRHVL